MGEIAMGQAMTLAHEDILANIQDKGINLSHSQYFVYLNKLNNLNTERLKNMPEEYKNEYIRRINTLKAVEIELWKKARNSNVKDSDQISALRELRNIQTDIQNFYNAGPIVYGMIQAIKDEPAKLSISSTAGS